MTETTAPMTIFAGSLYDTAVRAYFRTGMPTPSGGTIALGGYHAYRSLMWCDSAALREAIGQDRILRIAITLKSAGESGESAQACPVRLYRTDLSYDPVKPGWNSAGTTRFDEGMTYENPVNAHMPEYAQTAPLEKGGTLDKDVLAEGEAAMRWGQALLQGYAIGTWQLKSGSTFSNTDPPYHVRYITEAAVIITHEPVSTGVTPPTSAVLNRTLAAEGTAVTLQVSGAAGSESDPITGYEVCSRRVDEAGTPLEDWSDPQLYEAAEELSLQAGAAGERHAFRVRTVGAQSVSDYVNVTGILLAAVPPPQPTVQAEVWACTARLRVSVDADDYGSSRIIYEGEEPILMTGSEAAVLQKELLIPKGESTLSITVRDDRGGVSPACAITLCGRILPDQQRVLCWKGVATDELGITVTEVMEWPAAAQRQSIETPLLYPGGVMEEDPYDLYQLRQMRVRLYLHERCMLSLIRSLYSGQGSLGLSFSSRVRQAVLLKAPVYTAWEGTKGTSLLLTFTVQPYEEEQENVLYFSHFPCHIFNGGDGCSRPLITLQGTGDIVIMTGEKMFTLYDCPDTAVIDGLSLTAAGEDGTLLETSGEYPVLQKGMNTLQVSGNVSQMEVLVRAWYR